MDTEPKDTLLVYIEYRDSNNKVLKFRLIQEIQGRCSELRTYLGIDQGTLDGIKVMHSNPEQICDTILSTWKMRMSGDYAITWSGLLSALRDAQLTNLASHLEEALTCYHKQTKQ